MARTSLFGHRISIDSCLSIHYTHLMSLADLTSYQISQLVELIKRKEQLHAELARIDAELQSLESGSPLPKTRGRKPGRPRLSATAVVPTKKKRSKRLKDSLLKELEAAGSGGLTVKELSAKLKVKPGNVFSWFYTTGKKIKGIKKVGEAKYSYSS
jgi:hypothetical protein